MKNKIFFAVALLTFCMTLIGCSGNMASKLDSLTQKPGTFCVVTSFYPMYIATLNITNGVDGVEVVNMTKPQTGCLHDYQLTTEDMKALETADIFVINGGGMESFLQKVAEQNANLPCIDASKGINLIKDDDGEANPHVWMSVTYAIEQVKNITHGLVIQDPKHEEQYKANALDYVQKLSQLRAEMHDQLDDLPHKDIVTFHEAFPYFVKEFNLNQAASIEHEPGIEPTPAELEATIAIVRNLPVKAVFTEPQYPPSAADTIARETGASVYQLDPIVTGPMDDSAKDAYIIAMKKNAETLKEAMK